MRFSNIKATMLAMIFSFAFLFVSAAAPNRDFADIPFQSAITVQSVSPEVETAILTALNIEYEGYNEYQDYMEQLDTDVFLKLMRAEARHGDLLYRLAARKNIQVPAMEEPVIQTVSTLQEAISNTINNEEKVVQQYAAMLARQDLDEDTRDVFTFLHDVSKYQHVPHLQRLQEIVERNNGEVPAEYSSGGFSYSRNKASRSLYGGGRWDGYDDRGGGRWDGYDDRGGGRWDGYDDRGGGRWDGYDDRGGGRWDGYDDRSGGRWDGYDDRGGGRWDGYDDRSDGRWDGYDDRGGGRWDGYDDRGGGRWDGYDDRGGGRWDGHHRGGGR